MNTMKMLTRTIRVRQPLSLFATGSVFLIVTAIAITMLAFKGQVSTYLRSGETITAEFDRNYQVTANETKVKTAGLEVGVVSDVEFTDQGTVLVSMKVDESVVDSLGPKPSATVVPNTVLGGAYSIELEGGGGRGAFNSDDVIPPERTKTPVELDRILESLPSPTRKSLQSVVGHLDDTLASGGKDAMRDIVVNVPETFEPAAKVLNAAQGTRRGVDLPQIVSNLDATADVLSRHDGQLGDIVTSLRDTTAVLAEQSRPLADGIESLPATLRATRTGVTDLRGTLSKLTETAGNFRPAARELGPLLRQLDPVLRKARPLMGDLRPLVRDAQPLVKQLVPITQGGTKILNDLQGPVLDRVNGPITDTVMNTWRGSGPYKNSGGGMQANHKFYEELAYLVTNLDRASMGQDAQGSFLGFQVGANTRSVVGTPLTLPNLVDEMKKITGGAR